jgi:hypothetical protein
MGLDITGENTGHNLSSNYSTLHYTVRYLAMKFSGMPDSIGTDIDGKPKDSFLFCMSGHADKMDRIDTNKMKTFSFSMVRAGYLFPQILIHSDCEGEYTPDGGININNGLISGNSIELLKELEVLVNEESYKNSDSKQIQTCYNHMLKFYELVKDEIENGSGRIIFS